jgi:hypothetical protein
MVCRSEAHVKRAPIFKPEVGVPARRCPRLDPMATNRRARPRMPDRKMAFRSPFAAQPDKTHECIAIPIVPAGIKCTHTVCAAMLSAMFPMTGRTSKMFRSDRAHVDHQLRGEGKRKRPLVGALNSSKMPARFSAQIQIRGAAMIVGRCPGRPLNGTMGFAVQVLLPGRSPEQVCALRTLGRG